VNNIGGFLGPYSFGWLKEIGNNSTILPFIVIAAAQVLAGAGVLMAYRSGAGRVTTDTASEHIDETAAAADTDDRVEAAAK